jgi:hypothetical protein
MRKMRYSGRRSLKRQRKRYSWALRLRHDDPEVRALSYPAREGLGYARELAENANERSLAALRGQPLPERVTANDLGDDFSSPIRVNQLIRRARVELFGKDLSNSAIQHRLRNWEQRKPRRCAEAGCEQAISRLVDARTRYCVEHASPAARVRRHRQRRLDATAA